MTTSLMPVVCRRELLVLGRPTETDGPTEPIEGYEVAHVTNPVDPRLEAVESGLREEFRRRIHRRGDRAVLLLSDDRLAARMLWSRRSHRESEIVGVRYRLAGDEILIYGAWVHEEHRRGRLASTLLGLVLEAARGEGATLAYTTAEYDNQPSLAMFRKYGFVECQRSSYLWFFARWGVALPGTKTPRFGTLSRRGRNRGKAVRGRGSL